MDTHRNNFFRRAFLYVYYKLVQLRQLLKILYDFYRLGVQHIVSPPLILSDGTVINLPRSYYDYLVLWENLCMSTYEKHLPQDFSPKIIMDLGAHKGFFSIMAARRFPNAEIYAVEPSRENYEFLLENTKQFPNIHTIHAAVWNKKETMSLNLGGSVGHSLFKPYGRTGPTEEVDAITLDDLPQADFIKCDIEGSEHVLKFSAPYIALEVHYDIEGISGDVIENLKTSGYQVVYEPPIAYANLQKNI